MEKLPRIVQLAELVIIVADAKVPAETKKEWLHRSINNGLVTKEEAVDLLIHEDHLKRFLDA